MFASLIVSEVVYILILPLLLLDGNQTLEARHLSVWLSIYIQIFYWYVHCHHCLSSTVSKCLSVLSLSFPVISFGCWFTTCFFLFSSADHPEVVPGGWILWCGYLSEDVGCQISAIPFCFFTFKQCNIFGIRAVSDLFVLRNGLLWKVLLQSVSLVDFLGSLLRTTCVDTFPSSPKCWACLGRLYVPFWLLFVSLLNLHVPKRG